MSQSLLDSWEFRTCGIADVLFGRQSLGQSAKKMAFRAPHLGPSGSESIDCDVRCGLEEKRPQEADGLRRMQLQHAGIRLLRHIGCFLVGAKPIPEKSDQGPIVLAKQSINRLGAVTRVAIGVVV